MKMKPEYMEELFAKYSIEYKNTPWWMFKRRMHLHSLKWRLCKYVTTKER